MYLNTTITWLKKKNIEESIIKWTNERMNKEYQWVRYGSQEVGKQTFFRCPQIANLQILGLIPLSQSANFLGMPVRKLQIRKFLWLIRKAQVKKFLQNTVMHNSVSKQS
jgi:hypothetical protein